MNSWCPRVGGEWMRKKSASGVENDQVKLTLSYYINIFSIFKLEFIL